MNIHTLNDALVLKLSSLRDVEKQLVKALPKMARAATDKELKKGFEEHLEETKVHVERLEQIFELLGTKPQRVTVDAIRGLIEDAQWIVRQKPEKKVLDAQLIAAASYVEHYEIAGYMSARSWAEQLGYADIVDILQETLQEEHMVAEKMATLADERIDEAAV